jgi:hypothetical protein
MLQKLVLNSNQPTTNYEKKAYTVMIINSTNISKTNNHLELILTEVTEHKGP